MKCEGKSKPFSAPVHGQESTTVNAFEIELDGITQHLPENKPESAAKRVLQVLGGICGWIKDGFEVGLKGAHEAALKDPFEVALEGTQEIHLALLLIVHLTVQSKLHLRLHLKMHLKMHFDLHKDAQEGVFELLLRVHWRL